MSSRYSGSKDDWPRRSEMKSRDATEATSVESSRGVSRRRWRWEWGWCWDGKDKYRYEDARKTSWNKENISNTQIISPLLCAFQPQIQSNIRLQTHTAISFLLSPTANIYKYQNLIPYRSNSDSKNHLYTSGNNTTSLKYLTTQPLFKTRPKSLHVCSALTPLTPSHIPAWKTFHIQNKMSTLAQTNSNLKDTI